MGICPDTAEMKRSSSNSWSLPPTPTTKLGLWETISFLFYYRSFLLKGYSFPPLSGRLSPRPQNEGIQAPRPPSRNRQPSPLGAHFTERSKVNTMHQGIKGVDIKSELEIHDNALTTSTGLFLKENKFPHKSFPSIGGSSEFRTRSAFPPPVSSQPDRFMAALGTQVLNPLSLSRKRCFRPYF